MTRGRKIAAVAAWLLAATTATAADRGFYFGAFGGQAKYDVERLTPQFAVGAVDFVGIPNLNFPPPSLVAPIFNPALPIFDYGSGTVVAGTSAIYSFAETGWTPELDDKSTAWGIVAGYRIVRHAAVELNYQNLGKLEDSRDVFVLQPTQASTPTRPVYAYVPANYQRSLETKGPSVSALGILPILDSWSLYARAGVFFADVKLTSSIANSGQRSLSANSESLLYGVGTQVDFGSHWSVRAEFQRFNNVGEERGTGRADIDMTTLGVIFRL